MDSGLWVWVHRLWLVVDRVWGLCFGRVWGLGLVGFRACMKFVMVVSDDW